jgi:hypothetical protein
MLCIADVREVCWKSWKKFLTVEATHYQYIKRKASMSRIEATKFYCQNPYGNVQKTGECLNFLPTRFPTVS